MPKESTDSCQPGVRERAKSRLWRGEGTRRNKRRAALTLHDTTSCKVLQDRTTRGLCKDRLSSSISERRGGKQDGRPSLRTSSLSTQSSTRCLIVFSHQCAKRGTFHTNFAFPLRSTLRKEMGSAELKEGGSCVTFRQCRNSFAKHCGLTTLRWAHLTM